MNRRRNRAIVVRTLPQNFWPIRTYPLSEAGIAENLHAAWETLIAGMRLPDMDISGSGKKKFGCSFPTTTTTAQYYLLRFPSRSRSRNGRAIGTVIRLCTRPYKVTNAYLQHISEERRGNDGYQSQQAKQGSWLVAKGKKRRSDLPTCREARYRHVYVLCTFGLSHLRDLSEVFRGGV